LRLPLLPRDLSHKNQTVEATGRAIFQFMLGDVEGSRRQFEELFQRFPAPNEHYIYGLLLFPSCPDAATKEFIRESELYPANVEGQIMAAWGFLMKIDPERALPHATRAAQESPNSARAQLVLGRALAESGHAKEGIEHLARAVRIDPDKLETHIALAEAYSRAGDRNQSQRERQLCLRRTNDGKNRVALP
jgi:predicted Zn-dependent protease